MIEHIEIKNFAVIKSLDLDLRAGLNIITGETGAGKSVVIEAVSMALGSRADTDYIRTGCDRASIAISLSGISKQTKDLLFEEGIEPEEPVILKRELSSNGRSLCRVNGSLVPLSTLGRISAGLVDIHGQYDHQYLLDQENHMTVLDAFGGEKLAAALKKTSDCYLGYKAAKDELALLSAKLKDARREKELLSHELSEIEAAGIRKGEFAELTDRLSVMENSEKIFEALSAAYEELYSGEACADTSLGLALSKLSSAASFSPELSDLSKTLEDIYYQTDELKASLRRLRDGISFSPEELDECVERLELINSLKRKYGGSEESIIEYGNNAKKLLDALENSKIRTEELEERMNSRLIEYKKAASELSALRKEAADILSKKVNAELLDLNFKSAAFDVSFKEAEPSERGSDYAEFLISANRGEAKKPLSKVASGGELSRIMLALKRITGDMDSVPTMIFDEIDTGISGASAGVVGSKLKSISGAHQVVCITHLPQIACFGDSHYRIEKTSDEQGTFTDVKPLGRSERIEELARLLSGTSISDAARQQAKELLLGAEKA